MTPQHYYSELIGKAEERHGKPLRYGEHESRPGLVVHHIRPICEGGSNQSYNLVYLDISEHLRAHELLALIYGGMQAHIFISMAYNSVYQATDKQKLLAKTLSLKVYKDPELLKIFQEGKRKEENAKILLSSTGYRGVYPQESSKKNPFSAFIRVEGVKTRIGNYSDPKQAAIDYDIAAIQFYGENYPRNFPDLSLQDLRRLNLALRVVKIPVKVRKPGSGKYPRSAETRAKMSAARIGRKFPRKK